MEAPVSARAKTRRAQDAIASFEVQDGETLLGILDRLEDEGVLSLVVGAPPSRIPELVRTLSSRIAKAGDLSATTVSRAVNKALKEQGGGTAPPEDLPSSITHSLVTYGLEDDLFMGKDGKAYAAVTIGEGVRTFPLESEDYTDLLAHRLYQDQELTASSASIADALRTLRARAKNSGNPPRSVHLRFYFDGNTLWYDLGTDDLSVVRITAAGWSIERRAPVQFLRFQSAPQCLPSRNGSIDDLDCFINARKRYKALIKAYIVHALFENTSRFALCLGGSQGAAKTSLVRMIRGLLDPVPGEFTTSAPGSIEDLIIEADKSAVVAFDNMSKISEEMSNHLCQMVTGGSIVMRKFYTNADRIVLTYRRCVILGGIGTIIKRPDLLERTILVRLNAVSDETRIPDEEFWAAFAKDKPGILGAIFDIAAEVIRTRHEVPPDRTQRMADASRNMLAAGRAMNLEGEIRTAFAENAAEQVADALDEAPIGHALVDFLETRTRDFKGTAAELLDVLNDSTEKRERAEGWPKTAGSLGKRVDELSVVLGRRGWSVTRSREGGTGSRILTIARISKPGSRGRARVRRDD